MPAAPKNMLRPWQWFFGDDLTRRIANIAINKKQQQKHAQF